MTVFLIKIIACISMFLDHYKYFAGESNFVTQYLGRLAFPLFLFVLVEGYCHTRNVKKYLIRLGIAALISQVPYYLFVHDLIGLDGIRINVIATMFVAISCMLIWDKSFSKIYSVILIFIIGMITQMLNFDYGIFGIIIGMIFYIFREKKLLRGILFVIATAVYYYLKFFNFSSGYFIYLVCTILVLIPIGLYNGKKGRGLKYFFYLFYPVHMLFLVILSNLIN